MNSTAAPAINGVLETALYVDDLLRATKFYCDILGFRLMMGDAMRFQALDAGAGRVLLLFKRGGTLIPTTASNVVIPPHDGSGPQHVGFAIAADGYASWKIRLKAFGIELESEGDWPRGGKSMYFRDPDGHLLELITPGIWDVY